MRRDANILVMDPAPDAPTPIDEGPPDATSRRLVGYVLLAAAAIAAVGVGIYVFASGEDEAETPSDELVLPTARSGATPIPGTGVLDPERPEIGEPAPDFALVDARDGRTVRTLSEFAGTPVVLNFYASWCGPCRDEIPAFQAAQAELGDGVVFLGLDWEESQEEALSILDEYGASYPALLDSAGEVADHYRVAGLPVTFFIDAEGNVQSVRSGEVTEEMLVERLALIGVEYQP